MASPMNSVRLVGALHFVKGAQHQENRLGDYLRFSLKQDSMDNRGNPRHDFIMVRVYDEELKEWLETQKEGTPLRLEGQIKTSVGSGEMYVLGENIEKEE